MTTKATAPSKTSTPAITRVATGVLQRKCDCGATTKGGAKCPECEEKQKVTALQRSAMYSEAAGAVPSIVHEVLQSPGQPLDGATRQFFEPRFGADFSGVRVHTDGKAAESAKAVNSHAYTVGNRIVFGQGNYSTISLTGRRLLAHELAHTIQQGGAKNSSNTPVPNQIAETDAAEREAEHAAIAISNGQIPIVDEGMSIVVQRATVQELLDACSPDKCKPQKCLRVNGTAAHKAIEKDFRKNLQEAITPFEIPTASSTPFRTEDERNPTVIKPQMVGGGGRTGEGKPDLAARADQNDVEIAEIKPATLNNKGIPLGLDQLENYTEKGNSDEIADWRETNEVPGFPIRKFVAMPADRYKQLQPIRVSNVFVSTAWYRDGLLVYCPTAKAEGPVDTSDVPTETYEIVLKQQTLTFEVEVPDGNKAEWVQLDNTLNRETARSIPGLVFYRAKRMKRGPDKLYVGIETKSDQNPSALPLNIPATTNVLQMEYHQAAKELRPPKGAKPIPFDFTHLSLGEITTLSFSEDKGLSGKGVIRPSIPLLRGATLQIAFSGEELRVTAPVPKDKLKSLPGLRITEAGLNFELSPEFKPSGDIKFEIGPKRKPLGSGSISVSADEQGFLAQGDLNARVPGFDESTAKVTYRKETGWEGETKLRTSKDFVKNADVTVRLNDQGFEAFGNVSVSLPGDQTIDLSVAKSKNGDSITFKGAGEFKVPGNKLKPVKLDFVWDGERLTATGETGFVFKGFTGRMNVQYKDGKVSGNGGLDFEKGKAKGKLNIKMSPEQKFSGDGEATYKLTDNLIATAGIAVDEKEKVTLKGALEFPKPIELFKPFGGEKEIFSAGVSIPIPGASIATVGLKARIEGGLSAGYRIGPGELRKVKLQTMLNPFEENPDVDLKLSAQLFIGANSHISGSVSGALMVDAAIASASGGLRVIVTAELDGHLGADSMIEYRNGHFSVEGNLNVLLKLLLKLALDSFVKAEAGVGPFKAKTEKNWRLAAYTYDPGLQIGIRSKAPIRYDSSRAFQAPSLDQIEIVKPNLNLPDMMQKIFANSASSEVEKK